MLQRRTWETDYIRIDGSVPGHHRGDLGMHQHPQHKSLFFFFFLLECNPLLAVRLFQEKPECRVALLSITAAGVGLDLKIAPTVIFAELYWNPGVCPLLSCIIHVLLLRVQVSVPMYDLRFS
jgi:SNF2 family DNA or RNA helicase